MMMMARYWLLPYHPARAFLLQRGLYLLLALDAWLLMLEHGGRYGAGNFNVAHFAWLDRWLPMPQPALYVGLVASSGLLSLAAALLPVRRIDKLLLALLYTLAWAISMHDSYQHHYLLSWLLLFCASSGPLDSQSAAQGRPAQTAPWLPLCVSTCVIVYLFTAVAKFAPEWRNGAVLRALAVSASGASRPLRWLNEVWTRFGFSEDGAFRLAADSVLLLQLLIAAGYALCTLRDAAQRPWLNWLCSLAWVASVVFHGAAELNPAFAIGWFSYYMIWLGCVLLGPAAPLALLCRSLARLADTLEQLVTEHPPSLPLLASSSCLLVWILAQNSDLPGLPAACLLLLCFWLAEAAWYSLSGQRSNALRCAGLPALTAAALWGVLNATSVRFDYYRRAAGERSRMGEPAAALDLYRKAEQHAPPGKTRMKKIDQLERVLQQDGLHPETGEE